MTFEVKKGVRKGTPALISLWGPSGAGKTYSGLLLARGLVGDKGKIVVIDTENRRAEFYADVAGGWEHIDFHPPFTPQRYMEAMAAAEQAGADVILIDSMSHVWQGEGGVLDMAEASNGKGLSRWKAPKMAYQRMMNALLRSRVHVIFCLRAKEKMVQIGTGKDMQIVNEGLAPICEKNFPYEMMVAVQLDPATHLPVPPIKRPDGLVSAVSEGKMLSSETGAAISKWIGGGAPVDHKAEDLKRTARDLCAQGSIRMRDWWTTELTDAEKRTLKPIVPELQNLAAEADRAAAEESREENTEADPLDDPFTKQAAEAAE